MTPIKTDETRMLILKPSAMGDIVHTLPLLVSLKKSFPNRYIAWGVKEKFADLLTKNPYLDELIIWKERGFWRFAKDIRDRGFDIVLDLQGLFRTGLVAYLSKAPQRWGFLKEETKENQLFFLNIRVPTPSENIVEKYLDFAEHLQAERIIEFPIAEKDYAKEYIAQFFQRTDISPDDKLIGLIQNTGWQNKTWKAERFAQLGRLINTKKNWKVMLIWGIGEAEKAKAQKINEMAAGKLLIAPATTIAQLVSLLKRCSMVIGGDTGPLHLATALGLPVIGLYGPTPPSRNGPYSEKSEVVYHNLPCSPCWKRMCISKNNTCMDSIQVDEVMQKIENLEAKFF
ncbi:MAG: lipopolysaccharide heptosyltransferase II [Candidatus Ratteibacteria bacterium]|nr:lipopolysaccharide heptosyltransferase II [Candidatus Ratteibacteria bacterium]